MNTYTIHGVDFPVDSIDGKPDLFSVMALMNTIAEKARGCNGYGNVGINGGIFVFDNGYAGEFDAKLFVKKMTAMGVWVTDIQIEDKGRCAWGGHRYEVSLMAQFKFCYENVFGK